MNQTRITVLVEDTAGRRGLLAEHGLAFLIEHHGNSLLFDTGQGAVLAGNAELLGVSLTQIDRIALSHGHYDHTGGLPELLRNAQRPTTVYAHPDAFRPKYTCNPQRESRPIGIPGMDEQTLRNLANFIPTEKPTEIGSGIYLTGPIPRITNFEDTGGAFFTNPDCTAPDPLIDDQALFLETASGTVVVLGCAHAGLINTVQYIQTLTDHRPIHTIIGGMHLLNATPERLNQTMARLHQVNPRQIFPCHCTGFAASARLWQEFPEKCAPCPVGTRILPSTGQCSDPVRANGSWTR